MEKHISLRKGIPPQVAFYFIQSDILSNCFHPSPLSVSENRAFDGELPRQPEGSGAGQPVGAASGSDTSHLR